MRRSLALATVVALAGTGVAATAVQADVVVPVVTTVLPGLLTMTGAGVAVSVAAAPGEVSQSVGATVLTVSDLRGTTAGWAVTATYSDPTPAALAASPVNKALGGANVLVSSANPTGALAGGSLSLVSDQPLTSPVTVASTGASTGAGVTALTTSFKTRVPATAQTVDVFLGTVTYTVASVR
jgi:hypothetical protein